MRDRDIIVDTPHQRAVWKPVGSPGTVLADGEIAGVWRPRKSGHTLTVAVETFRPLTAGLRARLRAEADHLAGLRGASTGRVEFE